MKKGCMRSDCYANVNRGECMNNCFALKEVYKNDNKGPSKNHIVIDFDIPGDDGTKSAGIHLHYIYDGDTSNL